MNDRSFASRLGAVAASLLAVGLLASAAEGRHQGPGAGNGVARSSGPLSSGGAGLPPRIVMPEPHDWQKTLPQPRPYRAPRIEKVLPPVIMRRDSLPPLPRYRPDDRLTCTEAAVVLIRSGYSRVRHFDCSGATYGFFASRDGRNYELDVEAASGRIARLSRRR